MKGDPTMWILARASGITAYVLLSASVLAGLVLKARPFGKALRPGTVTEVHRTLALLGIGAIALHGLTLALDRTVPTSVLALLVPGVAEYRPIWTGAGVIAAELALLVTASFWARSRIGNRTWRRLHWLSYAVFLLAAMHGIAAGSDSGRPWALALYSVSLGLVAAATAWRALVPPSRSRPGRPDRVPAHAGGRERAGESEQSHGRVALPA